MVEKSTYTSQSSVTLKSLMPVAVKRVPKQATDILGNEESQFQFTFDAKFYWNDEIANNVDNSNFFENFSNWLRENNNNKIFPTIGSDDISITSISANSNGYIFDTSSDEAIYRISCVMNYTRWDND